jgi:hypothetical protein
MSNYGSYIFFTILPSAKVTSPIVDPPKLSKVTQTKLVYCGATGLAIPL